ncbi:MAG: glycine cleavage system aminomethyltransferase GcvT [Phycisphaerales bacterium JB040]
MLKTPVHQFHLDHGGQMVDYAGWEMPIRYTSVQAEHTQCRTSGAVFDVSHMGRLELKGLHAKRLLERTCTRRITGMVPGQSRYGLVCNERGGVRDDIIAMKQDDDRFLVVCNGANRVKIREHLQGVIDERGLKVKLNDTTEKTAMVAIQGPRVMDLIGTVSSEIPTLKRFRFLEKSLMIVKVIVSRTGYTGEDGVEVILPAAATGMAMKMLMKEVDPDDPNAVLKPAGLAARDTLRLEAAMPLYGHELEEDINALETGLDFAIHLDKNEDEDGETFIGQEALIRTRDEGGPRRRLVGIRLDGKRTPRQGMPVLVGGEARGVVTSGCLSPTLGCPIAMAYVQTGHHETGNAVGIDAGRATLEGEIVPLPFYTRAK